MLKLAVDGEDVQPVSHYSRALKDATDKGIYTFDSLGEGFGSYAGVYDSWDAVINIITPPPGTCCLWASERPGLGP